MDEHADFTPPRWLRNAHIQSILASVGPRRALARSRASAMLRASRDEILDCGEGIRLHGQYAEASAARRGLAVLIHGWHGHTGSAYLLAAAAELHARGFSVFRLHLRDHGPSSYLNRGLFNSVRLPEVVNAVARIAELHPHPRLFLGGFSLGGNFALRVALAAPGVGIALDRAVAICPVLDPAHTMAVLGRSPLYHGYFLRKWKRAMREKLRHFPEYGFGAKLEKLQNLEEMNRFFVPRYTDFSDSGAYLAAYALTGERLAALSVPCHLITSADDPVIPVADLDRIARPAALEIEVSPHGGHCGFIRDWRLRGWAEQRMATIFCQASDSPSQGNP